MRHKAGEEPGNKAIAYVVVHIFYVRLCRIMEHELTDIPLQPLKKSSEVEDEKAVAHDPTELREASKEQTWFMIKRWVSRKWKSVFMVVTTMLGYLLLHFAISAISPFYPIWVSDKSHHKS